MEIKVIPLTEAFPRSGYDKGQKRAAMLAEAGMDYHRACCYLWSKFSDVGPLHNFMLPTMHQTLELLTKAIATHVDAAFDPKKWKHKTLGIVEKYAHQVAVFDSIMADPEKRELIEQLEKSYLLVRYGEAQLVYGSEAWLKCVQVVEMLADDIHARLGLELLPLHRLSKSQPEA